jgi:hypothetical protein
VEQRTCEGFCKYVTPVSATLIDSREIITQRIRGVLAPVVTAKRKK